MTKPWDHDELIATVREAFARRDSLMQPKQGQALTARQRELQQLEQEEPGITHVDRDEHGNIRLF
jgi:hypothetical protein